MPTVTRLAGICPVCQGLFKVNAAHQMVHHGFVRPGDGSIHGDCFGVGWPAYQVSPAGCRAYRDYLSRIIDNTIEYQTALQENPPESIRVDNGFGRSREVVRGTREYDNALSHAIRQQEFKVQQLRSAQKEAMRLIAAWREAPLLEIDEEGLTPELKRERDARRDERAAQKAQRDAEKAARRERTERREAEKEAEKFEYLRLLQILASWPPSENRTLQARRLNRS